MTGYYLGNNASIARHIIIYLWRKNNIIICCHHKKCNVYFYDLAYHQSVKKCRQTYGYGYIERGYYTPSPPPPPPHTFCTTEEESKMLENHRNYHMVLCVHIINTLENISLLFQRILETLVQD